MTDTVAPIHRDNNMVADSTVLLPGLHTGVPGLDAVLGGTLPQYSFNIIAGGPGAGKTTLAQQMMFANATAERPALYFTVLGEPTLKMLRYQRRFSFFKPQVLGAGVQFINLSAEVLSEDLDQVLDRIVGEVERYQPKIVVVDSFRPINAQGFIRRMADSDRAMGLEQFIQNLALSLTTWEVTSFLIGEYNIDEARSPIFTVADGIFWLTQSTDRNSTVRKFEVTKIRGQGQMPGMHTFRITTNGVQIFPRIPEQQRHRAPRPPRNKRLGTGVPGLDEMMGGGVPAGDALLLTGPAGSGKTTFATQFIVAGLRAGESGVVVVFEEYPEAYLARAREYDIDLTEQVRLGKLKVIYLRPLDLSVDETLAEISQCVHEIGATRVVIDSLSGFEIALAPTFREDFQESLYRLVGALTAIGTTVVMTSEVVEQNSEMGFTRDKVSFVTDDIIMQRYVEIEGSLRKVLAVVKMRGSAHDLSLRSYEITPTGAVLGEYLRDYHGIITGVPSLSMSPWHSSYPGLTAHEWTVLDALISLRASSIASLVSRLGLAAAEIEEILARFLELDYVIASGAPGAVTYHALAPMGGR